MLFANCLVFILIALSVAFDEPMCSKFHYEEQLLTKMIKMEMDMEKLKTDMETRIKPSIEHLNNQPAMQLLPTIAFSAYNTAQKEYGDGANVVFENVLLNEGSSYDASTGIFTAKVKGLYHFTAHVCNSSGHYAVVAIAHDGNKVAVGTQYENKASSCGSVSSLVRVGVGEQVNVVSGYTHTKMDEDQYRRASFMGILVHA